MQGDFFEEVNLDQLPEECNDQPGKSKSLMIKKQKIIMKSLLNQQTSHQEIIKKVNKPNQKS